MTRALALFDRRIAAIRRRVAELVALEGAAYALVRAAEDERVPVVDFVEPALVRPVRGLPPALGPVAGRALAAWAGVWLGLVAAAGSW